MSSLFCTQWPSSVMATTPARLSEPMGASSSPAMFLVMAPVTKTLTTPCCAARSWMSATVPALSIAGDVLGMQTTEVNPPRAAAAVPVAMVSLAVWPGSRKWTCRSIKPGQTICPLDVESFDVRRRLVRGVLADGGDFAVENQAHPRWHRGGWRGQRPVRR